MYDMKGVLHSRCQSKNSLERVKEKRGDLVRKNVVVPTRGGYTRSESNALGLRVTSMFELNNGVRMTTLVPLSKQFLAMDGIGYCMLISAYNLHPTMTVADAVNFSAKHEDEDRGGILVRVIKPNELVRLIHDFCKDFFFKCIHSPDRTRDSTNEKKIKDLIIDSSKEGGKLLLELQEIKNDSVVNIRHFVAYDAERNILIEPSQQGAVEVSTDRYNQPLILYTLGYKDIYDIVGLYQLVPKNPTR